MLNKINIEDGIAKAITYVFSIDSSDNSFRFYDKYY